MPDPAVSSQFWDRLRRKEGYSPWPYYDNGSLAIGYGTQIMSKGQFDQLVVRIQNNEPIRLSKDAGCPGISFTVANLMAREKLAAIEAELMHRLPWLAGIDQVRFDAFMEMGYMLGAPRFCSFRNMINAAILKDWETAAAEALDSEWHRKDRTTPRRTEEIAAMILTGERL